MQSTQYSATISEKWLTELCGRAQSVPRELEKGARCADELWRIEFECATKAGDTALPQSDITRPGQVGAACENAPRCQMRIAARPMDAAMEILIGL
jgi:hypothetical protein